MEEQIIQEKDYESHMIEEPTFEARTRQQGNPKRPSTSALVITIPKNVCERYNIEKGHLIKFKFMGRISEKGGGKTNGKGKKN